MRTAYTSERRSLPAGGCAVAQGKLRSRGKGAALAVAVCLGAAPLSWGDTAAVSFSLPQSSITPNLVNGVDGFDFKPGVDLSVTALGWYDQNGDGLAHDHPVGIFQTDTMALVAPAATVNSASTLDSTADFRFEAVNPFTLSAGTTYTLAGYGEGPNFDPYVVNPVGGIDFAPQVQFTRLRTSVATGLEFPTTAGSIGLVQNVFLGPNFEFTASSVPTPPSPPPPPTTAVPLPAAAWTGLETLVLLGSMSMLRRRKAIEP
jgi:hypothetical protein